MIKLSGLTTKETANILEKLKELAEDVEYMHNFQNERSDIVEYIYATHKIMRILKEKLK